MSKPQAKRILDKIEKVIESPIKLQVGHEVWVKGIVTGFAGDTPIVNIDGRNYSFDEDIVCPADNAKKPK